MQRLEIAQDRRVGRPVWTTSYGREATYRVAMCMYIMCASLKCRVK